MARGMICPGLFVDKVELKPLRMLSSKVLVMATRQAEEPLAKVIVFTPEG
jgi:hypothetical protein